jgi:hypothetical protein
MKKNLLISLAVVIVLIVSFGLIFLSLRTTLALNYLNDHLDAGGLRMGMPEREVVKLIGNGIYMPGFGGYAREYPDLGVMVSFPTDSDNDLHECISHMQIENPKYSIFGIRVGDDKAEAVSILQTKRVRPSDESPDTFKIGEFSIKLSGQDKVDTILIWFDDRDIRDRHY